MDSNLVTAGFVIRNLVNFCRWGEEGLKELPNTLKNVIENKLYAEFILYGTDTTVVFDSFPKFCEAAVSDGGLGATKDILLNLCKGNNDVIRFISIAYAEPKTTNMGRPKKTQDLLKIEQNTTIQEPKIIEKIEPITMRGLSSITRKSPTDGGKEYRLERLATQAPEEYDKVIKNEKTVNAACVTVGLSKSKIQVNRDDPKQVARILFKHYGVNGVKEIIDELQILLV